MLPTVIADLFVWLRTTKTHPLIASCVFHCAFEYIHPFSDGNRRTGHLWHSLLLRHWNPLFEWLPIESMVAEHQFEYYDALGVAQQEADCTEFVEFMLGIILHTIDQIEASRISEHTAGSEAVLTHEQLNEHIHELIKLDITGRRVTIVAYIRGNPSVTIAQIASAVNVSAATVRRDIANPRELGIVRREESRKSGMWMVSRGLSE